MRMTKYRSRINTRGKKRMSDEKKTEAFRSGDNARVIRKEGEGRCKKKGGIQCNFHNGCGH